MNTSWRRSVKRVWQKIKIKYQNKEEKNSIDCRPQRPLTTNLVYTRLYYNICIQPFAFYNQLWMCISAQCMYVCTVNVWPGHMTIPDHTYNAHVLYVLYLYNNNNNNHNKMSWIELNHKEYTVVYVMLLVYSTIIVAVGIYHNFCPRI